MVTTMPNEMAKSFHEIAKSKRTPNPWNQIRGRRNNAQGHIFEEQLKKACQIYSMDQRAEVDKIPEPFRVLEKLKNGIFKGRFTAPAQPDFQGTLAGGGSIVFEAKYTTTDSMERNVLTPDQMDSLEHHHHLGAAAFVCIGIVDQFFTIPWIYWRDMKKYYGRQYVTQRDIQNWRVRFSGAVLFLDFVHDIKSCRDSGEEKQDGKR